MSDRPPSEPPRSKSTRPTLPGETARSNLSTVPAPKAVHSEIPDTAEIDFDWEVEAPPPRRPREMMPTLADEDPLRHDAGYQKHRDATRNSMPTLPDIDPLRFDVEPESSKKK
jgi:hypothetical protein